MCLLALFFADDVTMLVAADRLEQAGGLAWFSAGALTRVLRPRHLLLEALKTQNTLPHPPIIPKGVFRRGGRTVAPAFEKRVGKQLEIEARSSHMVQNPLLDFDPLGVEAESTETTLGSPLFAFSSD